MTLSKKALASPGMAAKQPTTAGHELPPLPCIGAIHLKAKCSIVWMPTVARTTMKRKRVSVSRRHHRPERHMPAAATVHIKFHGRNGHPPLVALVL
jgi:hypothetical protein